MFLVICDKILHVYFGNNNNFHSFKSGVICQFLLFKVEESRNLHIYNYYVTLEGLGTEENGGVWQGVSIDSLRHV
jgi:hypothetical protein